jgi:hypothetical protein
MVRRFGAALVVLGALGVVALAPAPARASCVGPRVELEPAEVTRGERVTISGEYWGDACNDVRIAGQKPEPVLGNPVKDIQIIFSQGERHIVVARGAADKRYRFEVPVRVPASLAPGSVDVIATWNPGGAVDENIPAGLLQITDAPPTRAPRKTRVVKFGP